MLILMKQFVSEQRNFSSLITTYFFNNGTMGFHIWAIQVLRNADGGGGVSDFLGKSVTKV